MRDGKERKRKEQGGEIFFIAYTSFGLARTHTSATFFFSAGTSHIKCGHTTVISNRSSYAVVE